MKALATPRKDMRSRMCQTCLWGVMTRNPNAIRRGTEMGAIGALLKKIHCQPPYRRARQLISRRAVGWRVVENVPHEVWYRDAVSGGQLT